MSVTLHCETNFNSFLLPKKV